MWFGFPPRSSCLRPPRLFARAAVSVAIAAAIGMLPTRSSSLAAAGATNACVHISRNVAHYCGSATARLSVFPAAVFRHGSCTRKRVGGFRLLQVRIGVRSLDGSRTNGGLPYFSLGIAGSHSRPGSGNVIAYYGSRLWVGRVGSFKGDNGGGTLVAQGIAGSQGRAIARFRC
jgi:hypothetical protein